jgi:hypothetical protein
MQPCRGMAMVMASTTKKDKGKIKKVKKIVPME